MALSPHFWHLLTRLGEMQILLPAALLACLPMVRVPEFKPFLMRWWLTLALATAITTATKLAFIGWGLGIGALNFTGISGHAMFAAAVYPVLVAVLASRLAPTAQRIAFWGGIALAVGVGISRIEVGAHSVSEVIAGLALGGWVTTAVMWRRPLPRKATGPFIQALVIAWMVLTPVHTPQSRSHYFVTRLSLMLAGREAPHTRAELLKNTTKAP
jgi:membrane-associated phospholipid phosphatase